jgi:3-hydroxyacyl-CoA dehydrogenase
MVDYTVDDGVAVLTLNNPPVNALSHGVRLGLVKGVEKALEDESASAIVIYCEGNTFIAGADITEFASGPQDPQLDEVLLALENSSKPTVAAIHGTALGGGLETAMAGHLRSAHWRRGST